MNKAHERKLRIVVFSSLYPNSQQPRHGIFVEQRVRKLLETGEVEVRVVAPVPWFWSTHPRYGRYARMAAVPHEERRHGIDIAHPRYWVVPKVGMTIGPAAMTRAGARALAKLRREGFDFDLIDSHYFYPDGVAASRLAERFERPFTVTARGADINQIAGMRVPARQIRGAIHKANGIVAVSRSLSRAVVALGADPAKVATLRNGVDLKLFAPAEHGEDRRRFGLQFPVWLCVGHLIERKGMHIALDALAAVDDITLVIVGDGPWEARLKSQAQRLGIAHRVRFAGAVAHETLVDYYNAADALVLPTRSEGMPNVVLEALACGTAVIATAVDGIPDIMDGPPAGELMHERTASALVDAWNRLQSALDNTMRAERRRYAEQFDWEQTSHGQLAMFERITENGADRGGRVASRMGKGG